MVAYYSVVEGDDDVKLGELFHDKNPPHMISFNRHGVCITSMGVPVHMSTSVTYDDVSSRKQGDRFLVKFLFYFVHIFITSSNRRYYQFPLKDKFLLLIVAHVQF